VKPFGLKIEEMEPGVVCVEVTGDLDMATAYLFDEELRRIEAREPVTVVVDLRGVTFMDSTGLARLLAAHRRARKAGRRLAFARGSSAVQRVFRLTAMNERFDLVSEPSAVLAPPQ